MLCAACTIHKETRSAGFLIEPQNQWLQFVSALASKPLGRVFGLGRKTGSFDLVICASKSPRRFLGLCLKTKQATVYRLRHKTDGGMKTVRGTRQDLTAFFMWKQVGLGFSSLASRLMEAWLRWCTWHHREGCVEIKLKMDGSM
jgi:hypothetical protein